MDRRYSPISEIPGAAPRSEPTSYWQRVLMVILLVIGGLFAYNSLHIVMRLRSDPPLAVVGARLNPDSAAYHSHKLMAQACWNYAIVTLQQEYPYGRSLPVHPPSGLGNPSAISALCWPRLRDVWTKPDSWVRTYDWDMDWLTDPSGSFQQTLHRIIDFLNVAK